MAEKQVNGLRFRDLWSSSLEIYQTNFKTFILLSMIILVIAVPWMIYKYSLPSLPLYTDHLLTFGVHCLLIMEILWVFIALTQSTVIYLHEKRIPSFIDILIAPRILYWRVIKVFLGYLIIFGFPALFLYFSAILIVLFIYNMFNSEPNNLIRAITALIMMIPLIFSFIFIFAPTSAIIEDRATNSFANSYKLFVTKFGRALFLIVAIMIITIGPWAVLNFINMSNPYGSIALNNGILDGLILAYEIIMFPQFVLLITILYLRIKVLQADLPIQINADIADRFTEKEV